MPMSDLRVLKLGMHSALAFVHFKTCQGVTNIQLDSLKTMRLVVKRKEKSSLLILVKETDNKMNKNLSY